MAYFQKTIVRYERDPRAAEDADFYEKWYCPCFLGTDECNMTVWIYKKEIIEAVENFDFDEG